MSNDEPSPGGMTSGTAGGGLDVERDSDVPISTQIFWQLAYQIDSGRLLPGSRLPPVRELGAALRVNPNTIRAVYRRLADAGYVTSRHGAGTHVADRPPQRRGAEALAGVVAEMLRRAAHAGFTADEVAAATFAAATERKRPGPLVRVLFAECTNADAGYDAERLVDAFPGLIEAEGTLIDDMPERLERFHYDLVATTTFHADECQVLAAGRVPVVAMLVGPGYLELVHEIADLKAGSRVGLVCGSDRGAENMLETLQLSGATGIEIVPALIGETSQLDRVDEIADLILMSREALAAGLDGRFARPERIRPWSYEFDPVRARAAPPGDRARRRLAARGGRHRLSAPAATCHTRRDMERIPLRRARARPPRCERPGPGARAPWSRPRRAGSSPASTRPARRQRARRSRATSSPSACSTRPPTARSSRPRGAEPQTGMGPTLAAVRSEVGPRPTGTLLRPVRDPVPGRRAGAARSGSRTSLLVELANDNPAAGAAARPDHDGRPAGDDPRRAAGGRGPLPPDGRLQRPDD